MMATPEAPSQGTPRRPPKDGEEKKPDNDPLATFGEVFSFAQTFRVKLMIACGLFCACVSGIVFPGRVAFVMTL